MDNHKQSSKETLKQKNRSVFTIVLLSLLWFFLIIFSFYTYYAIPALIFISWWIVAWVLKALKRDKHDGTGYDDEF